MARANRDGRTSIQEPGHHLKTELPGILRQRGLDPVALTASALTLGEGSKQTNGTSGAERLQVVMINLVLERRLAHGAETPERSGTLEENPTTIGKNHPMETDGTHKTHKHEAVRKWLAAHPRFKLHFTPTSSSWLNLVESWFSKLTQQRLGRGVFGSVQELVAAIKDYLTHHNADPKPFVWSTTVETILGKIRKCKAIIETHH